MIGRRLPATLHRGPSKGFAAAECIVVEDSWADVTAALAAKMKVIAYTGGISSAHEIPTMGVMIIDHMSQLPSAILKSIGN